MEEALIQFLLASPDVATLMGERLTPGRRDQGGALPAGVLYRIDGFPDYHLLGEGLTASRVQVDCWAASYREAKQAGRAIKSAASAARFTEAGVRFAGILVLDERDDSFDETGAALYRTSLDLQVHHTN